MLRHYFQQSAILCDIYNDFPQFRKVHFLQLSPLYPRPLIFRICLSPSQCEAFRYQGRMSNFNFSDICVFGGNTVHTRSCYLAVCGSLHTSMTEVTQSCYQFSSLFCYCFFIYFLLLFCFLFLISIRNRKQYKRIQIL
jgi:hypothetical protein